jgi:hypothetical protein
VIPVLKGFLIGGVTLLSIITSAQSAELIMVDSRGCSYCKRFWAQVGNDYDETAASQIAPIRRVLGRGWPSDLDGVAPAFGTPTFILVDDGQEIGRFAGFRNEELFWQSLNRLLPQIH